MAFSGVASSLQSEKVERWYTTTNLSLSNGINIVSALQRFMAQSGAQTLTFNSLTDRQTTRNRKHCQASPNWQHAQNP